MVKNSLGSNLATCERDEEPFFWLHLLCWCLKTWLINQTNDYNIRQGIQQKIMMFHQKQQSDRLNYEIAQQHKQALRTNVNSQIINQLQVSRTPSNNIKKAYKAMYQEQLDRTLQEHQRKKNFNHTKIQQSEDCQQLQPNSCQQKEYFNTYKNQSSHIIPKKFRDYQQERTLKLEHLIERNICSENILHKRQDSENLMRNISCVQAGQQVRRQIQEKENLRIYQRTLKEAEAHAFLQYKQRQRQKDILKKQVEQEKKRKYRQDIEQIINRNNQRDKHQRNQVNNPLPGRHNPITNPIEYHIDNPYLLRKMQQAQPVQTLLKRSSYSLGRTTVPKRERKPQDVE